MHTAAKYIATYQLLAHPKTIYKVEKLGKINYTYMYNSSEICTYTSIILTVNFNYTCVYQLSLIRISQILYSRLTLKKLIINLYTCINIPIIEKKLSRHICKQLAKNLKHIFFYCCSIFFQMLSTGLFRHLCSY